MGESLFAHTIDPELLERIVSTTAKRPSDMRGESYTEEELEIYEKEAEEKREKLKKLLEKIPDREKDMLFMRYIKQMSQSKIAEFFNVSQVTIHYRLQRVLERIKVLLKIIEIDQDQFKEDLDLVLKNDLDVKIVMMMFETSNQSKTGRTLKKSQYCVRSHWLDSIVKMQNFQSDDKEIMTRLDEYIEIAEIIKQNYHVLEEKLHKWKLPDKSV